MNSISILRHEVAIYQRDNSILNTSYIALTGRESFVRLLPKALPWASIFKAFSLHFEDSFSLTAMGWPFDYKGKNPCLVRINSFGRGGMLVFRERRPNWASLRQPYIYTGFVPVWYAPLPGCRLTPPAAPWRLRNNLTALFANPCRRFIVHLLYASILFFYSMLRPNISIRDPKNWVPIHDSEPPLYKNARYLPCSYEINRFHISELQDF